MQKQLQRHCKHDAERGDGELQPHFRPVLKQLFALAHVRITRAAELQM